MTVPRKKVVAFMVRDMSDDIKCWKSLWKDSKEAKNSVFLSTAFKITDGFHLSPEITSFCCGYCSRAVA